MIKIRTKHTHHPLSTRERGEGMEKERAIEGRECKTGTVAERRRQYI